MKRRGFLASIGLLLISPWCVSSKPKPKKRIYDGNTRPGWYTWSENGKDYENYVEPESHRLDMQKVWTNRPAAEFYK